MKETIERIAQSKRVIFTCSSFYNALLALCIILKLGKDVRYHIIMFSPNGEDVKRFKAWSVKISEVVQDRYTILDKKSKILRAVGLSDIKNRIIFNNILHKICSEKGDFLLVNFTWTQQRVIYPATIYYAYSRNVIFIEEGATQYVTPDDNPIYIFLKKCYGNQTKFWKDDKLEFIKVQYPERHPDYLRSKIKLLNLKDLDSILSPEEKDIVLKTFLSESERREIDFLLTHECGIVYTMPLSEDGYIDEQRKKEIFEEIVEYYSLYGQVVLKRHPRDSTDYSFIKKAFVINGSYPSELYELCSVRFLFAISLCSSAVENSYAAVKLNLNENFLRDFTFSLKALDIENGNII